MLCEYDDIHHDRFRFQSNQINRPLNSKVDCLMKEFISSIIQKVKKESIDGVNQPKFIS